MGRDRIGLGWRPELAAGILAHLDRVDVVEVVADDHFEAPRSALRALRTLASQVPVALHGVSLGLASTAPAARRPLEGMARVVDAVRPEFWSEHLAFVRCGGVEIGHLAAPPRHDATIEGTARNLEAAARVVGTSPLVENVATLVDPPGSDRDEASFVGAVLEASVSDLLLDLHNLHANAVNFGFSATEFLDRIPVERVAAVHLAGGWWIEAAGERRLLDDHLHDVPDPVFALLEELASRTPRPLTVILERDGRYPPMEALLGELDRARGALARGRARRPESGVSKARPEPVPRFVPVAAIPEDVLARLYVDDAARELFLSDPGSAGLDRAGLQIAALSFARKRAKARPVRPPGLLARLLH